MSPDDRTHGGLADGAAAGADSGRKGSGARGTKTMDPGECAEGLSSSLRVQAEICREVLELSRRQRALVAEENREDDLIALLAEKQMLIDRQRRLAEQALPYRDQWEESARLLSSPEARAKVEEAWNSLCAILESIVGLEDESRERLREQKGRVSIDIGNLQRGRMVNQAYGGGLKPPPAARYSDKRG